MQVSGRRHLMQAEVTTPARGTPTATDASPSTIASPSVGTMPLADSQSHSNVEAHDVMCCGHT